MPLKITGDKVNSLQTTGDLWVEVQLNEAEANANEAKKPPEHYTNIQGQTFNNAVVVQEHSCIQFKIKSKGEFGFGYRIVGGIDLDAKKKVGDTKPQTIVSKLYCLPQVSAADIRKLVEHDELVDVVQRYQDEEKSLIKVEGFKTLNFNPRDAGG